MQMCEFKMGEERDKLKEQRTSDDSRDEEKTLGERDDREWKSQGVYFVKSERTMA